MWRRKFLIVVCSIIDRSIALFAFGVLSQIFFSPASTPPHPSQHLHHLRMRLFVFPPGVRGVLRSFSSSQFSFAGSETARPMGDGDAKLSLDVPPRIVLISELPGSSSNGDPGSDWAQQHPRAIAPRVPPDELFPARER